MALSGATPQKGINFISGIGSNWALSRQAGFGQSLVDSRRSQPPHGIVGCRPSSSRSRHTLRTAALADSGHPQYRRYHTSIPVFERGSVATRHRAISARPGSGLVNCRFRAMRRCELHLAMCVSHRGVSWTSSKSHASSCHMRGWIAHV